MTGKVTLGLLRNNGNLLPGKGLMSAVEELTDKKLGKVLAFWYRV